MKIDLKRLIKNKLTYPIWTTSSIYKLKCKSLDNKRINIYYEIKGPVKRKISRIFPRFIQAAPIFIWSLGFLKEKVPIQKENQIIEDLHLQIQILNSLK